MASMVRNLPRRIAQWFLAGVLAILPVAVTVAIIVWVGDIVARYIGPNTPIGDFLQSLGLHFVANDAAAYALGVVIVLAIIFGIGVAVESGAGVLALLVSPERFRINGRDYQIIVVPTAPVPIGGGLLFVPAEVVQTTDMSVEGLMSIYVSMGITAGQFLSAAPQTTP